MSADRSPLFGRSLSATACAVMVAATVGADARAATGESEAVQRIGRYCNASWQNARISRQDWPDCTQQVFSRLLERVSRNGLPEAIGDAESPERRELNRSIWATIQRWRRQPRQANNGVDQVAESRPQKTKSPAADQVDEILTMADESLSARQHRILRMLADGWSVGEIADKLEMTPARTSDEKYKAIQKIRRHLEVAGIEDESLTPVSHG